MLHKCYTNGRNTADMQRYSSAKRVKLIRFRIFTVGVNNGETVKVLGAGFAGHAPTCTVTLVGLSPKTLDYPSGDFHFARVRM